MLWLICLVSEYSDVGGYQEFGQSPRTYSQVEHIEKSGTGCSLLDLVWRNGGLDTEGSFPVLLVELLINLDHCFEVGVGCGQQQSHV